MENLKPPEKRNPNEVSYCEDYICNHLSSACCSDECHQLPISEDKSLSISEITQSDSELSQESALVIKTKLITKLKAKLESTRANIPSSQPHYRKAILATAGCFALSLILTSTEQQVVTPQATVINQELVDLPSLLDLSNNSQLIASSWKPDLLGIAKDKVNHIKPNPLEQSDYSDIIAEPIIANHRLQQAQLSQMSSAQTETKPEMGDLRSNLEQSDLEFRAILQPEVLKENEIAGIEHVQQSQLYLSGFLLREPISFATIDFYIQPDTTVPLEQAIDVTNLPENLSDSGHMSVLDKVDLLTVAGIPESDWHYVDFILTKESNWRFDVWNQQGSSAYGLCQTMLSVHQETVPEDFMTNPVAQMVWCHNYALGRYGSWEAAYNAWRQQNWW